MRVLLAAATVLVAAQAATAADLKVGKGKPFATIQAAVDAASHGDRILVGPGFYPEHVVSDKAGLQFVGSRAVWDGITDSSGGDCLVAKGDDVSVRGFTFRNGSRHVVISGARARIEKCVSRNSDGVAYQVEGPTAWVANCRVAGSYGGAVRVDGDQAQVSKCRSNNGDDNAIEVHGDGAVIDRNLVQGVEDESGIYVEGAGVNVLRNTVRNVDEYLVYVEGDQAVVAGNRCSYNSDEGGIYVSGSSATVDDNTVTGAAEGGIEVWGDDMTVRGNRVSVVVEGEYGFGLWSRTAAGGALVEGNVAEDTGYWGFDLGLHGATVRRNAALRSGYGGSGGFSVSGSGCALADNVATDAADTAFRIDGERHELLRCRAVNAVGDGFQVIGATHRLEACVATQCGGEGLDNRATQTFVTGCSLRGNRIDVACSVANGATFEDPAAVATHNTFDTGGVTREPEVDEP